MPSIFKTRRWLPWSVMAMAGALAMGMGLYFREITSDHDLVEMRGKDAGMLFGVAFPDTEGRQQLLGQWKGKVLVVNFWATWCVPCRTEMPEFVRVQQEFGGRGLQFVGIAIDEPGKVKDFAVELGLNYPALIGGYGAIELSKTLGNRLGALPYTLIIDRSGHVVHTQLGPIREANLRSIVTQLL